MTGKLGVIYISGHFVLEGVGGFSSEEEDVAIMIQLRFIDAVLVHELGYPIGAHHGNDDAKQEIDAPGTFHDNDNLQKQQQTACWVQFSVSSLGWQVSLV